MPCLGHQDTVGPRACPRGLVLRGSPACWGVLAWRQVTWGGRPAERTVSPQASARGWHSRVMRKPGHGPASGTVAPGGRRALGRPVGHVTGRLVGSRCRRQLLGGLPWVGHVEGASAPRAGFSVSAGGGRASANAKHLEFTRRHRFNGDAVLTRGGPSPTSPLDTGFLRGGPRASPLRPRGTGSAGPTLRPTREGGGVCAPGTGAGPFPHGGPVSLRLATALRCSGGSLGRYDYS